MSQLDLALDAGVSTKHLSFVETGRAEPSRELLLKLSSVLGMPARDRNALLCAAGYQAIHRETAWESPENAELCAAVRLILEQNEPFGAVVLDRDYQVVMVNKGFSLFLSLLQGTAPLPPYAVLLKPRLDLVAWTFDPALGLRPLILNWPEVASAILHRGRAELVVHRNRRAMERFQQLLCFPGVAELLAKPEHSQSGVLLPVQLQFGEQQIRFFTTLTTLGTPTDITASELRIESYHPADAATAALIHETVGLLR
jgi:transcriptional regulator with XRE-family HTH domain